MPRFTRTYPTMATFDPNTAAGLWATFIPGRRPNFKVHAHLGHATNAMSSIYTDGIIYENSGGRWIELCRRDRSQLPQACPRCGSTKQSALGGPLISQRFDRDPNGRLRKPVSMATLCEDCWDVELGR